MRSSGLHLAKPHKTPVWHPGGLSKPMGSTGELPCLHSTLAKQALLQMFMGYYYLL